MTPRIPPEYHIAMPRWSREDEDLAAFMRSELDLASWVIGKILGREACAVQKKLSNLKAHRPDGRRGSTFGRKGYNQRPPMALRRIQQS